MWVWNNCIGRNLWLGVNTLCQLMMKTIKNALYWKILTIDLSFAIQCHISFEQFQISRWKICGSKNCWVVVCKCVWNLIFSADENESEIQFSIFLMHFTLPHTPTNTMPLARTPIVLWLSDFSHLPMSCVRLLYANNVFQSWFNFNGICLHVQIYTQFCCACWDNWIKFKIYKSVYIINSISKHWRLKF